MASVKREEIAEYYFLKGEHSQVEIADKVGVTPVTISKWRNKYKWDSKRKSLLITRPEQLANLYEQLSELNERIKGREKGSRYPVKGEADTQAKITASIRNLEIEISLADTIDVFMKFNDYVRDVDLEKAKEIVAYQDAYIKTLL